jgi:type I restriction enzyme, R subunit
MNEADTRAVLIDPSLKAAGWSDTQVTREYFYQRDYKYTDGRILVVGNQHRKATSRKVDYLLRYTDGTAIAVIEAKADVESAEMGLEQAKGYAKDLGLNFAYSSNGRTILEYDFFTHSSRELDRFPNPQDLWNRWTQNTTKFRAGDLPIAADLQGSYRLARQENPLLHYYCPESLCGKRPHYFQEVAIRKVIKRFMWGQRRALLALATGTGKTFISFQAVWKLINNGVE